MKTLQPAVIFFLMVISSCSKTGVDSDEQSMALQSENNLSSLKLTNTLTAHPWMYQEFYSHYIDEQHKGQRFYDRDSTNNLEQYMENSVYTFHKNHMFAEYVKYDFDNDTAYNYQGTWRFSDNKPTYLILKFLNTTETDSISLFNINHLNYFKKDHYSHWFTALVPKQ